MNAIELLEEQHRTVEAIFARLEKGRTDTAPLLEDLADTLAAHMAIEQELFYPIAAEYESDLIHEGFEEHALAEIALKRLLGVKDETSFNARLKAFKEVVLHHLKEEEEELFPKLARAMDEERLEELGVTMQARFEEVSAAGYESAVPKGLERTSADLANPARGAPRGRSVTKPAASRSSAGRARGSAQRKATGNRAKPGEKAATKRAQPPSRGAQRSKSPKQPARTSSKKPAASARARTAR